MIAEAPPSVEERRIGLFGFQKGTEGFVRRGTADRRELSEWEDYLFLLAHGGAGSGKSRGGAYRMLRYMTMWPRSFGIVTTPTKDMMRTATLPTIVEVFEEAGKFEGEHWEYNKTESLLWYKPNGSRAFCTSTEEPQHLRGQNCAWFWMDEPRDSPLIAFRNLQARLRQEGFPHSGWLTTTPQGRRSWIHAVFYPDKSDPEFLEELQLTGNWTGGERDVWRETELPDGRAVKTHFVSYPARTLDNPHGGAELYAQLAATYGENTLLAQQETDGLFVLMEGLTYSGFNADYHVVEPERWPVRRPNRVLAGVDFGFANPSAIVVEGIDGEGRRYILDEFYQAGCSEELLCLRAAELARRWSIQYFFCDTEDPRWIRALRTAGLPALRANKRVGSARDISSGIGLCTRALTHTIGPKKEQGFFVNPACKHWRIEIENYVRDEGRLNLNAPERPRKMGDHAMDAWRYAEQGIIRLGWDQIILPQQSRMPQAGRITTSMIGARG